MTQTVFSTAINVATMFYNAMQALFTVLLTHAKSWKQRRYKLLGYRWFWLGTITLFVALCMLTLIPTPINVGGSSLRGGSNTDAGPITPPPDGDKQAAPVAKKESGRRRAPHQSGKNIQEIDKAAAKRAVKNSQVVEFFKIYRDPENLNPHDLAKYWLPGSDALQDIGICLRHLRTEGWHYGVGSKLDRFEFRYVRLFGDHAEVGTTEHWFLPMVHVDGSPVEERNPDQGPYEVDYGLTKLNGRWLVATTTTPYVHKQEEIAEPHW